MNPADIGGRFSALSMFGMVPAAIMGVDIKKLLETAKEELKKIGINKESVLLGEYNTILDEIYSRSKKNDRVEPKKVEIKKKEKEIVKED